MNDLISREAAKAAIRKKFSTLVDRVEINIVLNGLPAVDAVPVVRCGECKYYVHPQGFCYVVQGTPKEDFYCAGGERRDEDERTNGVI